MSNKPLLIYQLNTSHLPTVDLVGSKARTLIKLRQKNVLIPPGFVISSNFFNNILNLVDRQRFYLDSLHSLFSLNNTGINTFSSEMSELIQKLVVPAELLDPIRLAYHQLSPQNQPVIVRSSANIEDTTWVAAAGIFESQSDIKTDVGLIKAIKACWLSAFSPKALDFYKQSKITNPQMAVIIQRYLPAEFSGICFTNNPVSGDHTSMVIEMVSGPGSTLANGQVNPVSFEINKHSWYIYKRTLAEEKKYSHGELLSDRQIIALAKKCQHIAGLVKAPQDIEWVYYQRQFYLVQSRHITVRHSRPLPVVFTNTSSNPVCLVQGLPIEPGVVVGRVAKFKSGQPVKSDRIIVAQTVRIKDIGNLTQARAIVTDKGSLASNVAILARELHIPCIVKTKQASIKLRENQLITLDARSGKVFASKITPHQPIDVLKSLHLSTDTVQTKIHCWLDCEREALWGMQTYLQRDAVLVGSESIHRDLLVLKPGAVKVNPDKYVEAKLLEMLESQVTNFFPEAIVYQLTPCYKPGRLITDTQLLVAELRALKKLKNHYGYRHLAISLPSVATPNELTHYKRVLSIHGLHRNIYTKYFVQVAIPNNLFTLPALTCGVDGVIIDFERLFGSLMANKDLQPLTHHLTIDKGFEKALEIVIRTCSRKKIAVLLKVGAYPLHNLLLKKFLLWGLTGVIAQIEVFDQLKHRLWLIEKDLGTPLEKPLI